MVTTRGTNARFTSSSRFQQPEDPKSPVNKFYKVVLPSTMKKNMMRIPPRFVKEQRSNLPEVITLETPVGFKRRIKLKKIGEEIWLHDGWSKFIEAHSIKEGHFLFFKYDGSTSFRVHIFNMSASEIDYPLDLDVVDISDSDDDLIEITEEEFFGTQSTSEDDGGDTEQNIPKKTPRDIEFDEIIHDVDEIYKEEEKEEGRVCSG